MQVYSLFILICLLQALICDKAGINQKSLEEAFDTSLPFIKSYHPAPFKLSGSSLKSVSLSYTELTTKNIQFKFDEFGLLHLKFVNLKGQLSGSFSASSTTKPKGFRFRRLSRFRADLSDITWEETYAVESTKKDDGKYDVKFKSMTETSISYKIFRVTISKAQKAEETNVKLQISKLNFTPLKSHLKKISGLILETLQNRLK
jgi:hypothetical protein